MKLVGTMSCKQHISLPSWEFRYAVAMAIIVPLSQSLGPCEVGVLSPPPMWLFLKMVDLLWDTFKGNQQQDMHLSQNSGLSYRQKHPCASPRPIFWPDTETSALHRDSGIEVLTPPALPRLKQRRLRSATWLPEARHLWPS